MLYFENAGKQNTAETLRVALERAAALGCPIVAASTMGVTADALLCAASEKGFTGKIVIVRGCSSRARNGANLMKPEVRDDLIARGAVIVTAAHALSAGERGISTAFKGAYPLEIMAGALRMFGQGTKVCVEAAVMALDADAIVNAANSRLMNGGGVCGAIFQAAGAYALIDSLSGDGAVSRLLQKIDENSFGIYLIHMVFLKLVTFVWKWNPYAHGGLLMVLGLSLAVFAVSWAAVWLLRKIPGVKKVL